MSGFFGGDPGPKEVHYMFIDGEQLRRTADEVGNSWFGKPIDIDYRSLQGSCQKVFYYDYVRATLSATASTSRVNDLDIDIDMKLAESLKTLVDAIERTHQGGFFQSELPRGERHIPEFVTARSGLQVNFEGESPRMVFEFAKTLMEGDSKAWTKIRIEPLMAAVRQAVADLYVDGVFAAETDWRDRVRKVKAEVTLRVNERIRPVTRHHPAWTCRFEQSGDFQLGPVIIRSRERWIAAVDFSDRAKSEMDGGAEVNATWKESLIAALQTPHADAQPAGLAVYLYDALRQCPAVVSVTISGYEDGLAKKVAEMISKTALDCVSLALGNEMFFLQQALSIERLPPIGSDTIGESNGYLHLPGTSISKRMPHGNKARIAARLKTCEPLLDACAEILWAHLEPDSRKHPKLSMRWATALEWFGEGARESTDSIALTKLGACLDILSSAGTEHGICDMLVNLTGAARDDVVLTGRSPKTLKKLVEDVYNHGRSEILHGNRYDRLDDMRVERERAFELARVALSESAVRLHAYTGPDDDKSFRTMPPATPAPTP